MAFRLESFAETHFNRQLCLPKALGRPYNLPMPPVVSRPKVFYRFKMEMGEKFTFRVYSRRLRRGQTIWNEHSYFEWALVHEGSGSLRTVREKLPYRKGALILTNTGEAHRWFPNDVTEVSFIQFHQRALQFFDSVYGVHGHSPHPLLAKFIAGEPFGCQTFSLHPQLAVEMSDWVGRMIRELEKANPGAQRAVMALFLLMCVEVERLKPPSQPRNTTGQQNKNRHIDRALHYIQGHFQDGITLSQLADQSPYSADYFSRLFKQRTRYHVADYLSEVRIRKACELLEEGAHHIGDVALRVGYPNTPYFFRSFKKLMACTPAQYRSRHRKNP